MENLKKGFYFECRKNNAQVFANGFYFKKGKEHSTDNTHVLSIGVVENGKLVNENWTGELIGSKFTPKFFCDDAVSVTNADN